MRADVLEQVIQGGDGGRLFAILTQAAESNPELPVFVFLNAGLVYRAGPARMNVVIGRRLAERGFHSVRVDLTGKGDTPAEPGADYVSTVHRDFAELRDILASRLGARRYVLCGLCSGADNVVRLAIEESNVVGMLLLDAYCYPDEHYRFRGAVNRYLRWRQYTGKLRALFSSARRAGRTVEPSTSIDGASDPLQLRVLPSDADTVSAVRLVNERGGSTLAIFTAYAERYYKHQGQFAKSTCPEAFAGRSEELWWRDVEHTYNALPHLRRLEDKVLDWSEGFRGVSLP
jgi:pimeloyl-ACP methyl ester carboxylesterase